MAGDLMDPDVAIITVLKPKGDVMDVDATRGTTRAARVVMELLTELAAAVVHRVEQTDMAHSFAVCMTKGTVKGDDGTVNANFGECILTPALVSIGMSTAGPIWPLMKVVVVYDMEDGSIVVHMKAKACKELLPHLE